MPEPSLILDRRQGAFLKLLGAIYGCAFFSLAVQIAGLAGSRGILPIGVYLSRITATMGASRYWNFPTVFWLGSSDLVLTLVCAAGVVTAILVIAGIWQRAALIVCWTL